MLTGHFMQVQVKYRIFGHKCKSSLKYLLYIIGLLRTLHSDILGIQIIHCTISHFSTSIEYYQY